ncbi:MAG: FG-GAP repeat protein [Vulcanibacillus sp.]
MGLNIKQLLGYEKQDSFGYAVVIGDINGDSVNELIVASANVATGGVIIYIYSEKTKKIITKLRIGKKKVNTIRLLVKDINQDKINELIVAITYQDLSGEVKVLSLKQNKTIYYWKSLHKYDAFGFSLAIGDVNGDGFYDIIVSAPNPVKNGKGVVYAYSGKDGILIKEFISTIPRDYCDFGTSVAAADINGDGVDEIIIGSPGVPYGEVFVYSAKHGWLIYKLKGEPGFGTLVYSDDINGDNFNEIIVTTKNLEGNTVSVFGNNFRNLYDIKNDEVDIGFGETITTGDINGDSKKELIIGAFDANHLRKKYTGQVSIHDGTNGVQIQRWYGREEKDQFGFSLFSSTVDNGSKDVILIGAPREMLKKKGIVYLVSID